MHYSPERFACLHIINSNEPKFDLQLVKIETLKKSFRKLDIAAHGKFRCSKYIKYFVLFISIPGGGGRYMSNVNFPASSALLLLNITDG